MPRALLDLIFLWRGAQYTVCTTHKHIYFLCRRQLLLLHSFVRLVCAILFFFLSSRCCFVFQNYERRTRQPKPNTIKHATVHTFSDGKMYQREFSMQFLAFGRSFLRFVARHRVQLNLVRVLWWYVRRYGSPYFIRTFYGFSEDTSYVASNDLTRMMSKKHAS